MELKKKVKHGEINIGQRFSFRFSQDWKIEIRLSGKRLLHTLLKSLKYVDLKELKK